ncbi:MAG: three-Cys-motif partner protein TcmP [Candidatus Woesearchaeota archaeon]
MQQSNYPFKTWPYEKQTEMKHLVFEDYFDKWVKILGKNRTLNYIDCYGGAGIYERNGELFPGSPIRAAQVIEKNQLSLARDTRMVVIEKTKSTIDNLQKAFEYFKVGIKPIFIQEDFDVAVNKLLDSHPTIAPTFFLVDPFGFKVKLATIKRIMQVQKSEVLLNFMYDGICRNLSVKEAKKSLTDLFGTEHWQDIDLCNPNKEHEIVSLFRQQLKTFCDYVYPYRVCRPDMQDRTYYYLFHLTNHHKGCSIMKSCFAKYNLGRLEFNDQINTRMRNQATLFDPKEVTANTIGQLLLAKYKGVSKSYEDIIKEFIDSTPFLESDFIRTIKALESAGKVQVLRNPDLTAKGHKRKSIYPKDSISF